MATSVESYMEYNDEVQERMQKAGHVVNSNDIPDIELMGKNRDKDAIGVISFARKHTCELCNAEIATYLTQTGKLATVIGHGAPLMSCPIK